MSTAKLIILILAGTLLSMAGCKEHGDAPKRGVYYWSTSFSLDSTKLKFLKDHSIDRIYLRLFDVVSDNGAPHPNATVLFPDTAANSPVEIVPVVYIHNDVMAGNVSGLGAKILDRIGRMAETHGFGPVKELQIDCDWTGSTRKHFFEFMDSLHTLTTTAGITLSVTIRLHQLAQKAPSADKGILMVYNTGDMTRLDVEKPILDLNDVKPYLRNLSDYPLPLATAYPIYRWDLLFRNGRFVDIIHSPDEIPVLESDSIVIRQPSATEIITTRRAVESARADCSGEILLFDLNNYNINRYSNEDFETFFD